MNILSLLVLSLPVLTGILAVHLLWIRENNSIGWILKISLGTGMGLGVSSLLYFVYLLFFAGKPYFLYVDLLAFLIILVIVMFKSNQTAQPTALQLSFNTVQTIMLVVCGILVVSSFIGTLNYARQRMMGHWDAWMIYNRTARFIYRGQEAWQNSFSEDINVIFHADYPLLLSLNIASRWDILDQETAHIPMLQSVIFPFVCIGLSFGALARLKSLGQAALSVILFAGSTFFIHQGGTQTADLPLAFYILASIILIFFYFHEKRPVFMVFAGLASGLAAWTKNEGILFMLVSGMIMAMILLHKRSFRDLRSYFIGLLLPLTALLYFKFQLAPSSEFFSDRSTTVLHNLMDLSRHQIIFRFLKDHFLHGGWGNGGIFLILCIYYLLFHSRIKHHQEAVFISLGILACQIMGYYVFYLITPYDLEWHVSYSLSRLMLHIIPAFVFIALLVSQPAEIIFRSNQNGFE